MEFGNPLFVIQIISSHHRLPKIGEDQTSGKLEKSNPPLNGASAIHWEPLDVPVDLLDLVRQFELPARELCPELSHRRFTFQHGTRSRLETTFRKSTFPNLPMVKLSE
jgi:hypothetical protein